MSIIESVADVEFGEELPTFTPDTSIERCTKFAQAVGWGDGAGRFSDHERAKKQGLPGALVPGIMGMGFFTIGAVVTDIDEEQGLVELDMTLKNEADETRVFGTALVRLPLS